MTSIIWDMGGTLVDTYPQVDSALHEVAVSHGADITIADVSLLTRDSIESAIETLSQRFDISVDELEEANEAVKESWKDEPAPLMDGALEVMQAVRDSGGLNLVVTHRDRASATTLIEQLGLRIDDMLCAPDGFPRKPDSKMYELILLRNEIDPDSAIAVGDRDIDTKAAACAHLRTAFLSNPELGTTSDATWNISSLRELLEHI